MQVNKPLFNKQNLKEPIYAHNNLVEQSDLIKLCLFL